MKMWRRNDHVEVYRLGGVVVGLRIKIQRSAILVNSRPKITPVNAEHDVSDPLGDDYILADQVIHELLGERDTLFHL